MLKAAYLISMFAISVCCAGCAATILQSAPDQSQVIRTGSTEAEITQRFGKPVQSSRLASPTPAQSLNGHGQSVTILSLAGLADSQAIFEWKGRLDSKARAGQAGFDSFMTLGLAELYWIPKALWERTFDEVLQLTVWFSASGEVVAYHWKQRDTN